MVTITLALLIPVSIVATGFFVLKAVQLGLRWQMEIKKEEKPTMEVKNPIQPIIQQRQEKEQTNILNEWFHGEQQEKR